MNKSRLLSQVLFCLSLFLILGVKGYAQPNTPTITPVSGTYASPLTITISDTTAGASIYYTTNGVAPTTASTHYTVPFVPNDDLAVNAGFTVNAIAYLAADCPAACYSALATPAVYGSTVVTFTVSPNALVINDPTANAGAVSVTATSTSDDYSGTIALTCSGLPSGDSCLFNPSSITVTPAIQGQSTLTIGTGLNTRNRSFPLLPAGASLAVALCFFGLRKRRSLQLIVLLAGSAIGLGLFAGCGTPGSVPLSQPVTITGVDSHASLTFVGILQLTQMQSQ
jgi:hypothetical protein